VSPFDVKKADKDPDVLQVADVRKRLDALREEEAWMIRPDNPALQKWDFAILIALLFTAVITPFEVAFLDTKLDVLFIINRVIDCVFICDMGKEFNLMYFHENGYLIKSHRMIRRKYLHSWFIIDFITIIPYDLAKYIFEGDQLKTVRIIRLLRLLKLARIFKASRIFTRWKTRLGMQHGTLMAMELSIGLTAGIHWFACTWGLLPFLLSENETTWLSQWLDGKAGLSQHCYSWTEEVGIDVAANGAHRTDCITHAELYIACVQLAVMTITGAGPGIIAPTNIVENLVILFLVLISGVLWANIIGQICGIAAAGDPVLNEFHAVNDDLNRFMDSTSIPIESR
jgi:potassium voltage-gated channel Eag-related subfamily H protein 7